MLQLAPSNRVFLAVQPVDFRKGIDGLAQCCRQRLGSDPFSGGVFVFRNRSGNALKILIYDGQGFWLCMKRFSKGKLQWWPQTENAAHALSSRELQVLLWNGNPMSAGMASDWRRLG